MKLFGTFEAVKFPEEDMIFITQNGFLYYIFNCKHAWWNKYSNAGNDYLTVSNYPDVSREELIAAMKGIFPEKETDFMRLCRPYQLSIGNMLDLLSEDYQSYLADYTIYHAVRRFLEASDIRYRSFEKLQSILENATNNLYDNSQVLAQIKDLSFVIVGRDIFRKEIGIVDGHDCSSYFWIMPVRVIDFEDTAALDSVAEMRSAEISIEEGDVAHYLMPFLNKYFDEELEANKKRNNVFGFAWYLEHNFFTFESIRLILEDIADTVDALTSGRDNEFTEELKKKRGSSTCQLVHAEALSNEEITQHHACSPTVDNTGIGLILDFYYRFTYRMEYMLKVGQENGYDLISFMGP